MTNQPARTIVDCATGEITIVPLTAEEIAEAEAFHAEMAAQKAVQEAEAQAKADAKISALAKLAALGLTEEEAAAIAGV